MTTQFSNGSASAASNANNAVAGNPGDDVLALASTEDTMALQRRCQMLERKLTDLEQQQSIALEQRASTISTLTERVSELVALQYTEKKTVLDNIKLHRESMKEKEEQIKLYAERQAMQSRASELTEQALAEAEEQLLMKTSQIDILVRQVQENETRFADLQDSLDKQATTRQLSEPNSLSEAVELRIKFQLFKESSERESALFQREIASLTRDAEAQRLLVTRLSDLTQSQTQIINGLQSENQGLRNEIGSIKQVLHNSSSITGSKPMSDSSCSDIVIPAPQASKNSVIDKAPASQASKNPRIDTAPAPQASKNPRIDKARSNTDPSHVESLTTATCGRTFNFQNSEVERASHLREQHNYSKEIVWSDYVIPWSLLDKRSLSFRIRCPIESCAQTYRYSNLVDFRNHLLHYHHVPKRQLAFARNEEEQARIQDNLRSTESLTVVINLAAPLPRPLSDHTAKQLKISGAETSTVPPVQPTSEEHASVHQRFGPVVTEFLESQYEKETRPNRAQREEVTRQMQEFKFPNVTLERVTSWFWRRRFKARQSDDSEPVDAFTIDLDDSSKSDTTPSSAARDMKKDTADTIGASDKIVSSAQDKSGDTLRASGATDKVPSIETNNSVNSVSDQDLARPGTREPDNGLERLTKLIARAIRKALVKQQPSPNKTITQLIETGLLGKQSLLTDHETKSLHAIIHQHFPSIADWQVDAWTKATESVRLSPAGDPLANTTPAKSTESVQSDSTSITVATENIRTQLSSKKDLQGTPATSRANNGNRKGIAKTQTPVVQRPATGKTEKGTQSAVKQCNRCTTCIENKKYCDGEPVCGECKSHYIAYDLPERYCSYPFIARELNHAKVTPADYVLPERIPTEEASKTAGKFWRFTTEDDFPVLPGEKGSLHGDVAPSATSSVGRPRRGKRLFGSLRGLDDSGAEDDTDSIDYRPRKYRQNRIADTPSRQSSVSTSPRSR